MKGLTKRQQEVLTHIREYIKKHNLAPSYREIMQAFGFQSLSSVAKHIQVLVRKGALTNEKYSRRSLSPVNEKAVAKIHEIELPYIGHITESGVIETFAKSQTLAVPPFMVHNPLDTYVLRAKGSFLNEEMITDGDLLVVEARQEAFAGETIVATTDQKKVFIKKYHPEGRYVRLTSLSEKSPSMIQHQNLSIQGIVISLLRLYL